MPPPQRTAITHQGAVAVFRQLLDRLSSDGYRGWEFDDFLASPVLGSIGRRNLLAARVVIQAGERLPVNLRPLLRVPKSTSTKAWGFVAKGLLRAHGALGDPGLLGEARSVLDSLLAARSPGYSGVAWGNDFDFASRGGYFPKNVPTVVWTSHIGEAFLWAFDTTSEARYGDAVVSAASFVMRDLERHHDANGICIAYAPGRPILVHNSNLLGAVALLRAWKLTADDELLEVAREAYRWSLSHVRDDGSIAYGVGSQWAWSDNFHTGYVLDCLLEGNRLAGDAVVPAAAIDAMFLHWRSSFFEPDGTPKYYAHKRYPLDIQCASQAIETFCRFAESDPGLLQPAEKVLRWTIANMSRGDGYFVYRRGRVLTNRLPSLHWGQATMLDALGAFVERSHAVAA